MVSIESWSAVLLQALAGASLRALVLAGIAGVALWVWRGRTAPVQHAVWTVVAAAMMLLLLGPLLPPVVPLPAAMDTPGWLRAPAKPAAALPLGANPVTIPIDGRGAVRAEVAGPRVEWGWGSVAAAVYLAGLLGMLGRLAIGSFLAGRFVERSARVRAERVTAALDAVAREQGAPMPWPAALESADLTAPVVVGRQAPVILLPAGWREWDDWKLRAVLAHELAHVRRGDGRTVVLAAWNRAMFWFHPLAWWMERRLAALCEQACDDAAVRTMGDAPRYAQVLLEIAAAGTGRRVSLGISMAGVSPTGRRIDRLLAGMALTSGLAPRRARAGIALATLPVVVVLAMAQARGPRVDLDDVRPGWNWPEDGHRTSAEQARELERQVAREPEALGVRAKLIAYYCYNADFEKAGAHVFWVIANRPESELAGAGPTMSISLAGFGTPAELERVGERARQLWKEQAARHDGNLRVLEHAADALRWAEPAEAERFLQRARELDGGNKLRWVMRLAALYAEEVAADTYTKAGVGSIGGRFRLHAGLGERVREQLAGGTDLEMAGHVGAVLAQRLVHTQDSKLGQEGSLRKARWELGKYAEGLLVRASEKDAAQWAGRLAELRAWLIRQDA